VAIIYMTKPIKSDTHGNRQAGSQIEILPSDEMIDRCSNIIRNWLEDRFLDDTGFPAISEPTSADYRTIAERVLSNR